MEPEVRTFVMDVAADGYAVMSAPDGTAHTAMRWESTPNGMALTPISLHDRLSEAWEQVYALRDGAPQINESRLLD